MGRLPVLRAAWEYFLSQQRIPNETVYHYTNLPAFLSIVRSKSMWATELRFMNDPDELTYSEELIGSVIDEFILVYHRRRDAQRALWLALLKKILHGHMATSSYYSISFCELHDLRDHWDYYGERGEGVALGWSIDSPQPEIPIRLGVLYDESRQRELVKRMVDIHLHHFRKEKVLRDNPRMLDAAGSLGFILSIFLYNFKRASFACEFEYRYVYQGLDGSVPSGMVLGHRRAGTVEKPYVVADFSQTALRHVVLGPSSQSGRVGAKVRAALDANGYAAAPIYIASDVLR
jgi:hypothetical protein